MNAHIHHCLSRGTVLRREKARLSGEASWCDEKGLTVAVRYLGEPLTVNVSIRAEGGSARVRVMNTLFGVREIAGCIG